MFSSASVCLSIVCLQDYAKTSQPIFRKFGEKVAHASPLDFCGNPDHVKVTVRVRVTVEWGHRHTPLGRICVTRRLSNTVVTIYAISVALAEVCAPLSTILVPNDYTAR